MDNDIAEMNDATIQEDLSSSKKDESIGARLKKAREAMKLSPKEVAGRLYLKGHIIESLEREDFLSGPSPSFMLGYLRTYAKLLNFPEQDIKSMAKHVEENIPPALSTTLPQMKFTTYDNNRYLHWITYLIMFILIAMVVIWWYSQARSVHVPTPIKTPFQSLSNISIPQKVPPLLDPSPTIDETPAPRPAFGIMLPSRKHGDIDPNSNMSSSFVDTYKASWLKKWTELLSTPKTMPTETLDVT